MTLWIIITAFIAGTAFAGSARAESCRPIDLRKQTALPLSGTLNFKMFPGPPNFEDIRSGDQPEPTYILKLDESICVSGSDMQDGSSEPINDVQVYAIDDQALDGAMRRSKGQHVTVTAKDPDVATTGHHHAPLVTQITSISADGAGMPDMEQSGTTTVRGFYEALEAGDGDEAAKFIVPEKRQRGPFSAKALSGFYATLLHPLKLGEVRPIGQDTFEARYSYLSKQGACAGVSVVSTVERGRMQLIQSIQSKTGC